MEQTGRLQYNMEPGPRAYVALAGAVAGGVLGAAGGPVGVIAGVVVGAVAGGTAEKVFFKKTKSEAVDDGALPPPSAPTITTPTPQWLGEEEDVDEADKQDLPSPIIPSVPTPPSITTPTPQWSHEKKTMDEVH